MTTQRENSAKRNISWLEALAIEAVDAADARCDALKFQIVRTAGAAANLMLVKMDHFMGHRRHQQIGGFDHLDRDADFIELRLGFDAAAEMAETVAGAHYPENKIIRMRKIHPAEWQSGAQIFISILQAIWGQVERSPDALDLVPVCGAFAHGEI